ncbi:MAG: hypothetical protein E6Q27_09215 [Aeromicrobium sp.]|nr:MAG: hypothetical protein E6Q27_09215 [Aeromicrobium sp.]
MSVFITVALLVWAWHRPNVLIRIPLPQSAESRGKRVDPELLVFMLWPLLGFLVLGVMGLVLGTVTAPLVRAWVARLDSAESRQREAHITADVPIALGLMGAVVASGRTIESTVALVAKHTRGPLGDTLQAVSMQLDVCVDPQPVWRGLAETPLARVGRTFARTAESGSSVVLSIQHAANSARKDRSERKSLAGKQVATKTAIPLGLCFLPAFVFIGIVPLVLGLSSGVLSR